MLKFLFSLSLLFSSLWMVGQSNTVSTFNFESTTRDTLISFPTKDHNSYERILMHYTMRCKDGLVSTGSERNRGCGEWDYSCNTYVVDSTRVDSLKAMSDEFEMPGFDGDIFNYTNEPTYTYYQTTQQHVTYDNTISEVVTPYADADQNLDFNFLEDGSNYKIQYLIPASYLVSNNLDSISGLRLDIGSGNGSLEKVSVMIAEVENDNLEELNTNQLEWNQYVNDDYTLSTTENLLKFNKNFIWNTESSIVIQISYSQSSNSDLVINAQDFGSSSLLYTSTKNQRYKDFTTGGKIRINEAFDNISDEITISYWLNGDNSLPRASSTLEGNDASNNRQVNIHHPWGNGQIYWDCGAEGGSYDRINKQAIPDEYKNKWNHWAFTKNATTGEMKIFLNGELWHLGTDKFRSIDLNALNIGGSITNDNLSYYGKMDELRVWNKALDEATIKAYMNKSVDDAHPNKSNLVLYYDFNETQNEVIDLSGHNKHAMVEGALISRQWKIDDFNFNVTASNFVPNHSLVKGTYERQVEDFTKLDSLVNFPQLINHYQLNGTDLELVWSDYYYEAKDYPIYDEDLNVVGSHTVSYEGSFEKGALLYYQKFPMAFEIMSFVTPYGIGLDFGLEGLTWTFDVTDFGPILKNNKRIYMTGGGQWQEEMDIRFEFIDGVPDRDVIDITQIWPVRSTSYQNILSDWRYEPRSIQGDFNILSYKVRTAITGHGQEGEFIPRSHYISADGFNDVWEVWKECSENPVFPQGGTWIYDRAGWCPGMATDVREYDVSRFFEFNPNPVVLDYSLTTATGDSRYYVNSQLIKYGEPNKTIDMAISDVVSPNDYIEHKKFNPACSAPVVKIKNHGSEGIRSATIKYGIVGISELEYEWTGFIGFLNEQTVELPAGINLALGGSNSEFFARIETDGDVNEGNNELRTPITMPDHYTEDIIIEMRTNLAANETSYQVVDENGTIILQRLGNSLSPSTTYRDTLKGLNGCFELIITDTGSDGISWWANNDGNGYVRIKEDGQNWNTLEPDFGSLLIHNFTSNIISSTDQLEIIKNLKLYPNPGSDNVVLSSLEGWDEKISLLITDINGRLVLRDNALKIDLSNRPLKAIQNLDNGVYFINISDSNKIANLKFIKM